MPTVFRNPALPDYFVEFPEVRADAPLDRLPSLVEAFEAGRVITLPNLRFDIDHDYWAGLPTDAWPGLKKLTSRPPEGEGSDDLLAQRMKDAQIPPELAASLSRHIRSLYDQILPVYERLFADYRFVRRHVVWRLNTIMNENMHVDTYGAVNADHFARMFINLDTQPRIWTTSWPIEEIYARFADKVKPEAAADADDDLFRTLLNRAAFGATSKVWYDREPRHVAYFQPGECWIVDSRQVAHQIFYGRRAVSIDFFVELGSMRDPERHYLATARRLRPRQPSELN